MAQHHDSHSSVDGESDHDSPGSSAYSPTDSLLASSTQDDLGEAEGTASSIGPQRTSGNSKGGKEKRKRSRVTPEQLVRLERFFAVDRSPTAARRRDISELLGMHERQTQIWFQNRRAKAKLHDSKQSTRDHTEPPPNSPPQLSLAYEVDLHNLIHEDEPVTIIPCTDLTIGTWRRIANTAKHDLVAYVSQSRRSLTWFIHSGGYGFKMEVPFDFIVDIDFRHLNPGSGVAVFALSRPPLFYLEHITPTRHNGSVVRTWKRCADWTEDHQASKVLRHTLVGSAVQLAHVIRSIRTQVGGIADISNSNMPYGANSGRVSSAQNYPTPPVDGGPYAKGYSTEQPHRSRASGANSYPPKPIQYPSVPALEHSSATAYPTPVYISGGGERPLPSYDSRATYTDYGHHTTSNGGPYCDPAGYTTSHRLEQQQEQQQHPYYDNRPRSLAPYPPRMDSVPMLSSARPDHYNRTPPLARAYPNGFDRHPQPQSQPHPHPNNTNNLTHPHPPYDTDNSLNGSHMGPL